MFTVKYIAPALFGIALSLAAAPGFAQSSSHQGHGASELALSLNAGEKWQGDDNMHKGMDAIRNALAGQLAAIHEDRLPAEDYKSLAATVMEQTNFMIENCVLEPEVDEQLHSVLGQVIEGASDMEAGSEPRAGAVMIVQALNAYGEHFEHPGWQPLD
ncbi:hypothetical protein LZG00_13570 [Rhodobacteraceae bacterium LMO-12]|nr:hypothetical protein [Rhodobacteraceae bacterium LMO-JJ12]